MTDANLNPAQTAALEIARTSGTVFTGWNGRTKVAANTIRALARRGLLVLETSPDGDVYGKPVRILAVSPDRVEW